jgi:hypothetical protein
MTAKDVSFPAPSQAKAYQYLLIIQNALGTAQRGRNMMLRGKQGRVSQCDERQRQIWQIR